MFFFFNQKYCSRTQVASPPTPLRKERGVITVIPLVVRRYFHLLLLKQTVSCTPPLCRRGGWGGEAFFYYAKREDVKSSFTSSLFTYILFLVPLLPTPHYVHIHKDILVSALLPAWEGVRKSQLGDLLYYCPM